MSKVIPTAHIEAKKSDIAKVVFMPGDPLRAEKFARRFLKPGYKKVSAVRNIFAFTGRTKDGNKKITIMAHGMGMSSAGIYAFELFNFYGVERIVRLGTAASHKKEIKNFDIVVATETTTDSNIGESLGFKSRKFKMKPELVQAFKDVVERDGAKAAIHYGNVHSSDHFYLKGQDKEWMKMAEKYNSSAKEMEAYVIEANARLLGKESITVVTIAHEIFTSKSTTSIDREKNVNEMAEIAIKAFSK